MAHLEDILMIAVALRFHSNYPYSIVTISKNDLAFGVLPFQFGCK